MADFCHEFDPGGLGCSGDACPDGCLGDFEEPASEARRMLSAGYEVILGICEGHGCVVYAVMDEDGVTWCEHHGPSSDEHATESPKRIKVVR